jgi:hypothetical protein
MNDKTYQIKNDEITILLDSPDSEGRFNFYGLISNIEPEIIYKRYSISKSSLCIYDFVYEKLQQKIKDQLREYIIKNLSSDYSFYQDADFWTSILHCSMDLEEYPEIPNNLRCTYSNIVEGIVRCQVNSVSFSYDYKSNEFSPFVNDYRDKKEVTALQVFYSDFNLNRILAIESYKSGKPHKTFKALIFWKTKKH